MRPKQCQEELEKFGLMPLGLCFEEGEAWLTDCNADTQPIVRPRAGVRACVLNAWLSVGMKGMWGSGWMVVSEGMHGVQRRETTGCGGGGRTIG